MSKQVEAQRRKLQMTEELLKLFSSAIRSLTMYPHGHPLVKRSNARLVTALDEFFHDSLEWTIVLMGGEFVFEKVPLAKVSTLVGPMFRLMSHREIESITVKQGVTPMELAEFIDLLLTNDTVWANEADLKRKLDDGGITNITFRRVELPEEDDTVSTDTDEARDIYSSLKHAVTRFYMSLFDPRKFPSLDLINVLRARLVDSMAEDRFAIVSRLHTKHRDDDLVAHSINTAIMSYVTAQAMGLPPSTASDIFLAGLLHDIGIMDIPPKMEDGILLASKNKAIYLEHPMRAIGILRSITGVPSVAEVAAYEHHLQWDLKGFPKTDRKRRMSLAGCIVAIASQYDRYMHGETYSKPENIAHMILARAGTDYEPRVAAYFLSGIGVYPPGTFVKLTDDQVAVVVEPNRGDICRPYVKVLNKNEEEEVGIEHKKDLTEKDPATDGYLASIKSSILPNEAREWLEEAEPTA